MLTQRMFIPAAAGLVLAALDMYSSGSALAQARPAATDAAPLPVMREVVPNHIPSTDSPEMAWWRESMETRDQRLEWWREARFGMFIHWGVYSELGGVWEGQPVRGYSEHIQRIRRIPIPVYREQVAGKFNPVKFDADEWARLAKEAGMGYLVITAKHHDGFAMYDSDVSDYNIMKATPWARDPMRELKAACDRHGIKFGFYYSQAFDWGEEDGAGNDWDYENPGGDRNLHGGRNWWDSYPQFLPRAERYVNEKAIPQIRELIEKYDPEIIWFDTPHKLPPAMNLQILKATREAGPNIVINNRIIRHLGDYRSTTDRPAEFPPQAGDWEGIPTTNESYGWHQGDDSHKPASHFIELIVKAAARGGNLMLNVGPRGDGTIDAPDVAILRGIGAWMKVNGESIHGTERTPLPVQAWGESTRKENTLYLHVFNWPRDGVLVVGGLKTDVSKAYVLSDTSRAPLPVRRDGELDVRIDMPDEAPDAVCSVVVIECEDEPQTDDRRLLLASHVNTLRVFDGRIEGRRTMRFGPGKRRDAFVEQWGDTGETMTWPLRVTDPVSFDVTAVYDAADDSAGGRFAVRVDGQTLNGTVQPGRERSQAMGTVRLEPGVHDLLVEPIEIAGSELMRLRSILLVAPDGPATDRARQADAQSQDERP